MEAVNDGHITLLSKPSAKSAPPRQAPHGPVFAYSKSKMLPNLPTGQPALFGGGVQDNSLVNPLYPNLLPHLQGALWQTLLARRGPYTPILEYLPCSTSKGLDWSNINGGYEALRA